MPRVPCQYRYAAIERIRPLLDAAGANWLNLAERATVARFADRSRRETWLAGRLLAKRLIAGRLVGEDSKDFPVWTYAHIEIHSAGARPWASVAGRTLDGALSIAHTRRGVLVALGGRADISLGVDLVEPGRLGPGFADVWFTPAERRRWLADGDSRRPAIIWAIKEAVYKALNRGEAFEPRRIEVISLGPGAAVGVIHHRSGSDACQLVLWQTSQQEIAALAWRWAPAMSGSVKSYDANCFSTAEGVAL
jgi:phosphopantetheinyl transferase